MIVAGEASGDAHAAKLVSALRESSDENSFEFFGATGEKLRQANVETVINADDLAIIGLPEIARALPMFWRTFRTLKNEAVKRKADAVILVDFPEFNLKLARALKNQGLKVIYYISPQLWAWRKHRVKTVARYIDLMITILPFEKGWYAEHGVSHVEYVGNPLAKEVYSTLSKKDFCAKHALDHTQPIIALLPGSRHKEIVRILPEMLETSGLMARENPEIQFIIALSSTRRLTEVQAAIARLKAKKMKIPRNLLTVQGETREALNASDAAAVASGTATLETALIGTPMAIVYKTSAFNYKLLRPLIKVDHFGLINLIARKRLAKEFIQNDFTPRILSDELFRLLESQTNNQMRESMSEVVETLGHGGASKRAAAAILRELKRGGGEKH